MRNRTLTITLIFALILNAAVPVWGTQTSQAAQAGQSSQSVNTAQAGKTATIKMPGFTITVNGVKVNNAYKKYPFIICNDITYFPMTYNDCRFLGIENYWKGQKEGLTVDTTGITAAYLSDTTGKKNSGSYQATIPSFPIQVNGKVIDNQKQQYPLLSFRDITYFPLTWDYAVKEFGWDYSFNPKNGLNINSDNIILKQIALPKDRMAPAAGELTNTVAMTDQYFYYENKKGEILQASLSDPSKTKMVYQLPLWTYGHGEFVYANLYNENGTVYLSYHQGGAVMGSDYVLRLNDDRTTEVLQESYTKYKIFGDKRFDYYAGPAPGPGNLSMKVGNAEYKTIGDPDYLYGWAWTSDGITSGGGGADDVYLIGDDLYILAYNMKPDAGETTGIYKVNINTNETTRLSSHQALGFKLDGDLLYYQSDGILYNISVKDGQEKQVKQLIAAPNRVAYFEVLNGNLYWRDEQNNNLFDMEGKNRNPGAAVNNMKLMGDKDEYLVCTFQETSSSKYRIMVFDKKGAVVFKTSNTANCNNISIKGKTIYFYNNTSETICMGQIE